MALSATYRGKPDRAGRRGFSYRRVLLALAVLVVLPALAYPLLPGRSHSAPEAAAIMLHKAERGPFFHDITERGELESANNVEIRCEVKAMGYTGTTLLEIVPEGTVVQPGDILAKLDSSGLENDRTRQMMAVANSEADYIKARTTHETAVLNKEEYLQGKYLELQKGVQGEVLVAKENLRRAEEYLAYSKKLKSKGFITGSQLEADAFAVQKAGYDVAAADKKLEALEIYTLKKMEKSLDADIEAAEARLKAQQHSYELEQTKLADIENQIAKCVLRAPVAGQVVYANLTNTWGGREVIIEAGATVRERQALIRLPDHTQMQVKAKISEGKVALVAVGQAATVRLDAFADREFPGVVEHINEYPAPSNRFTSSVKEYETQIRLIDPPPGIRPGLTAEVKIHVEQEASVLQVPVQAVLEHGPKQYCVILDDESDLRAVEVQIGSTNDKFVVIKKGIAPGQEVLLNATALRSKLELPEIPNVERPRPNREKLAAILSKKKAVALEPGVAKEEKRPRALGEGVEPADGFAKLDRNRDGKLDGAELPDAYRVRLSEVDLNRDGAVSRDEWRSYAVARSGTSSNGGKARPPAGT